MTVITLGSEASLLLPDWRAGSKGVHEIVYRPVNQVSNALQVLSFGSSLVLEFLLRGFCSERCRKQITAHVIMYDPTRPFLCVVLTG